MQLYLIRHGDYLFSEVEAPFDLGLSATGREQAERLRDRLATGEIKADVLISSPAPRAWQTAEIVAPALGLPIVPDEDVQEWRNFKSGAEQTEFESRLKEAPAHQKPYVVAFPGGESWAQFALRACTALNRISQEQAGKTVAIVCHGGIVEASFLFAYGLSPLEPSPIMMMVDPAYTSITHWRKLSDNLYRWRLEQYNDIYHLRDKPA